MTWYWKAGATQTERRCSNNVLLVNVWICLMIMTSQQEPSLKLKEYIRPSKKKIVVYHPRFSTKFGRADGFFLFFIHSVCGLYEQSRGPLRNGRCCSVLYVAASVTGSTGSAAYTWPTLTKIKTQQEYIRISYVLLLIKNPARATRPHNGNSSSRSFNFSSALLPMCMQWATERTGNSAQWNLLTFFLNDVLRHFDGMDEESYAYLRVYQFFSK